MVGWWRRLAKAGKGCQRLVKVVKELIIDIDLWRRRLREAKRGLLRYRKVLLRHQAELVEKQAEFDRIMEADHVLGRDPGAPAYTCPRCGRTSFNRNDVENQYCGNCHLTKDQVESLPEGADHEDHP